MVVPALHVGGEGIFAGVSARPVTAVMADRHRFNQGHVEPTGLRHRASDLGNFEGVRQPGALMITGEHKHLGLSRQPAKRRRVQNAVTITFETGAYRIRLFLARPIAPTLGHGCSGGGGETQHFFALFSQKRLDERDGRRRIRMCTYYCLRVFRVARHCCAPRSLASSQRRWVEPPLVVEIAGYFHVWRS